MLLNLEQAHATGHRPIALPSETVVAETRFGTYEFAPGETVMMPNGLVGFADQQLFGLGNLPAPLPEDFKLMQSLGEPPISFIVMPMSSDEAPIEEADLDAACAATGFVRDQIHVMFLCIIRPKDDGAGIDMWANIRAPILFDLEARQARQYVLPSNRYPLRQPLDRWNGAL
jgi:flagellar assembly factor FliW